MRQIEPHADHSQRTLIPPPHATLDQNPPKFALPQQNIVRPFEFQAGSQRATGSSSYRRMNGNPTDESELRRLFKREHIPQYKTGVKITCR